MMVAYFWLACTQTHAVSVHANETRHYPLWEKVTFTDQMQFSDPCRSQKKK